METLIIHPSNKEQSKALKTFMKALKIPFEEKRPIYNPGFVAMIKKGDEYLEAGNSFKVDIDNLWK